MRVAAERTETENLFETLANNSPVGLCIIQDGKFCYTNPTFQSNAGYREDELLGRDSLELIVPEDKEIARENAIKMLKGELLSPYQFRVIHKDGSIIWVMATIRSIQYHGRRATLGNYMEITERKQTDEALKAERNKLQSLIDAMENGLTIQDRDYNIIYQNEPLKEIFGDQLGEKCYRIYEGREKMCEGCPVEKAFKDGKSHTVEREVTLPSGKVTFWENTANPIRDAGGKIVSCLELARDITERKRAEESLKNSEEKYRELANSITDVFFAMDEHLRYTYWNKASEILIGLRAEDTIGKSLLEIFPDTPGTRRVEKVYRAVLKTQKSQTFVSDFDIDGRHYIFEISAYPSRGGISVFVRDITERKRAEERLRILFEFAPDGYYLSNLEGNFVDGNKAAEQITGYKREELIGKSFLTLNLLLPEEIQKAVGLLAKNALGQATGPDEFTLNRKDGNQIPVEITTFPVNIYGESLVLGIARDITERKQAEEALRQSEERYRTILEEMEDSYFEVDLGGHLTFVNNSVCRNLGYSREELIGMSYKGFTVEEAIESVFRTFNEVYLTAIPNKGFPWKTIHKDGSHGFAETSVSLLREDKGEIIGFRGVGRDITERKQVEEALRQSEERYRTILEEMEDSYFEVDLGGHLTFVNSATCRNLGYSRKELIGMSYKGFTLEDDTESVFRTFNEVYLTGKPNKSFSWTVVHKDGSHKLVEHSALPLRNDKGEIIGFRGVGRDITERKQAEEALRQSEEKYRALFDSSVIGTFIIDAETMKVVMANQVGAEMFGFSSVEETTGVEPFEFIPLDDREEVLRTIVNDMFEQDLRQTREFRVITKDGREIWISGKGARVMHEGRLAGLVALTDITEQKQQNEQLMMADRLASVGELAAGTAHELNNPLTSVIGFSQLLMEEDISDDARKDVELIYKEAQRAANVIKNLLTFARKHAPMKQLNQINNIIEDVLKFRAYEQKVNGIEVKRQLAPDLPEIMVDYFQMQQVFLNIIINAEYFMIEAHNRGTLTITTKKQNGNVRISIADDGPGISKENLRRLFNPFFTTKEAGKGTGLGLSICHGIVSEHGGQIYAKSQPGKGATIVVELPINSADHIRGTP